MPNADELRSRRGRDVEPPTTLPEETVVPLTALPTAHPSVESTPATPAAPPASHDSERSSTAEGDSSGTGSEAASA
jgi:hypothetical protein